MFAVSYEIAFVSFRMARRRRRFQRRFEAYDVFQKKLALEACLIPLFFEHAPRLIKLHRVRRVELNMGVMSTQNSLIDASHNTNSEPGETRTLIAVTGDDDLLGNQNDRFWDKAAMSRCRCDRPIFDLER
jgi:hypothetical protein